MAFSLFRRLFAETAGTLQCIRIYVSEDKADRNSLLRRLRNLSIASDLAFNAAASRVIASRSQAFPNRQVLA